MPLGNNPLNQLRKRIDIALILAVQKKSSAGTVDGERIQHLGCVDEWAIVEG
jgi:hypothetical protein